jgi:biopolymer transport protein ExbD
MVAYAGAAGAADRDPLIITIKIDQSGVLYLGDNAFTLDQVTTIMSNTVTEYGPGVPVHFDVATNVSFGRVWKTIEACRCTGIYKYALIEPPQGKDEYARPLTFYAPFTPDGQKHKGLTITNLSRTVRIAVDSNSLSIHGRSVSGDELSTMLPQLSLLDSHMAFIIEPKGQEVKVGRILQLMRQLNDCWLYQVSIIPGDGNAQQATRGDVQ